MSETNIVCPECDGRFSKKSNLYQHARKFHPEKAHIIIKKATYNIEAWCNDCGKSFSKIASLKKHVRLFHADKIEQRIVKKERYEIAVQCDECGKTFSRKSNLNQHIKKFHLENDNIDKTKKTNPKKNETISENILYLDNFEETIYIKTEHNIPEENLAEKCRGCLSDKDEAIHNLFDRERQIYGNECGSLADILLDTNGIKVEQEIGFPLNLCGKCADVIINFYTFKNTFKKTEIYLNTIRNLDKTKANIFDLPEHRNSISDDKAISIDLGSDVIVSMDIKDDILYENNDILDTNDYKDIIISTETVDTSHNTGENYNNFTQKESNEQNLCKQTQLINNDNLKQESSKNERISDESDNSLSEPTKDNEDDDHNTNLPKTPKLEPEKSVFTISDDKINKIRTTKFKKRIKTGVFDSKLHSNIVYTVVEEKRNIVNDSKNGCFICDKCGMNYKTKRYLKSHQETHSKEKKYVCQYCNKALKLKSSYFKHLRLHIKPRQIVCEVCGQKFNERSHLKRHHEAIHLGMRDHQCLLCEKSFAVKSTLERHKEACHNPCRERKWACPHCDLVYMGRRQLSRHHKIKHPGEKFGVGGISSVPKN